MNEGPGSADFIFEVSWEVANMVGGIHTVLASKARTMRERFGDNFVCIGPRVQRENNGAFIQGSEFPGLEAMLSPLGITVATGRWNVPGTPRAVLVDFSDMYKRKNAILEWLWLNYRVDSLTGGWDYIEPALFGYAAGQVIDVLAKAYLLPQYRDIVTLWHEWMVGSGLLYLKQNAPELAGVFVTHATVLGRAVCGVGGSLPDAIAEGQPAAVAKRLGVTAKHSLEAAIAREADSFVTVSSITAEECKHFHGRVPDVLVPNGIGNDFPPNADSSGSEAREAIFQLADTMALRRHDRQSTRLVVCAGRYEYVNKGLNLAVDGMAMAREGLAAAGLRAILVTTFPTAVTGPTRELLRAVKEGQALQAPVTATHMPQDRSGDPLLAHFERERMRNDADDPVTVINCPIYLDGRDPILPHTFYDIMPAFDLSLYPSAYEPWGYTPLESLAYGVPAVTSDLAGFGRWIQSLANVDPSAAMVLPRAGVPYERSCRQLADHIVVELLKDDDARAKTRKLCREVANQASWSHFIDNYLSAFDVALKTRSHRQPGAGASVAVTSLPRTAVVSQSVEQRGPRMHLFTVRAQLPQALQPLRALTSNLWWTWNPEAEALFHDLSPTQWEEVRHNPIRLLEALPQSALNKAAADSVFLQRVDAVNATFNDYLAARKSASDAPQVAYFCMEYGLHESMPFYSGGLGVLAGDYMKAASDAHMPIVGVGLAYRKGYFKQTLDAAGNQHEEFAPIDFTGLPMQPIMADDGTRLKIYIRFPSRTVTAQAWRVSVGAVQLYLLDTDHPQNAHSDRDITGVLYASDRERRLQQEIVLGVGGSKLLRALGIAPRVFHMNESHTAFLTFDRQLDLLRTGEVDVEVAAEYCRRTSVFTTHTPIDAGHETYSEDLLRPYLSHFQDRLHQPWDRLMALGRVRDEDRGDFNMSIMAIRNSAGVNGVSKIHRRVSQRMFSNLMPDFHEAEVPIGSVTNGAHVGTWLAPEFQQRFDALFGRSWRNHDFDQSQWDRLAEISNGDLRETRQALRGQLLDEVVRRLQTGGVLRGESFETASRLRESFGNGALVVGFARRFVPYKRPMLMFKDMASLEALLRDADRPVVLLFAGKAHPADTEGKRLIREIWQLSRQEHMRGSLVFLEGYDMALARRMVRGCDVWLNNPLRPLEASGTSGMKAGMNGCLNLSILDGWWAEGYRGDNGFSIDGVSWFDGSEVRQESHIIDLASQSDDADCDRIHWLLRHEILPRFFEGEHRPGDAWMRFVRRSMISTLRDFSAKRMAREYDEQYYQPAMAQADQYSRDGHKHTKLACERAESVRRAWPQVRIVRSEVGRVADGPLYLGETVPVEVTVRHPGLECNDLLVELVTCAHDGKGHEFDPQPKPLQCVGKDDEGDSIWHSTYEPNRTGPRSYGIRVMPKAARGLTGIDLSLGLVRWA